VLRIGSRTKRKVLDDDDESDVYIPDAKDQDDNDDDEDLGSMSAEESPPSAEASSEGASPEPILRKSKSKLSKFNASTPVSSSPSTRYSTPKPALGAFGKPLDKGERAKKFTETNKDRYSWLLDIRDKEGNRPGEENYDLRTLYIPNSAWKSFTAFERQYWYSLKLLNLLM
jgi:DNA mismatch repair protein MSH6